MEIKIVGVKRESSEDMRNRVQAKEEHEALENRERVLLARLKKKYEESERI
jgi:hypothetical protein